MPANQNEIEKRLWEIADELRANSKLKSSEYSGPVLGLIFLRYADHRFTEAEKKLSKKKTSRREIGPTDYHAMGVMYLPDASRFSSLLNLPEGSDVGMWINKAMELIENENEDLRGVLPKTYRAFDNDLLKTLLKTFASIPMDIEGDVFGKIYEYFLGEFAKAEGSKGGEFFTPTSLVKLIVEIIEPFHGRIFDPACGSGGMFVQSARFVENHHRNPTSEITVFGQEKTDETVRLCKMNLAVHGLSGDVRQGNSYYEDIHRCAGRFDFVMANPPFNVDRIDKDRIKDDRQRFPFGMPRVDNGNYIWIQMFYAALNANGRAGFVMANSASDARASELEIRKKLIESGVVDVMIAIGSNFFYTVTLPCTLWFLDKSKAKLPPSPEPSPTGRGTKGESESEGGLSSSSEPSPTGRGQGVGRSARYRDTVLFVDARHLFRQVDRAHREFTPDQIEFIANIARLYRGEKPEFENGSESLLKQSFPKLSYANVPGLCKVATIKDIKAKDWSLNPGRYVGVTERPADEFDFFERLEELNEELQVLNAEAHELEEKITDNIAQIMEPA